MNILSKLNQASCFFSCRIFTALRVTPNLSFFLSQNVSTMTLNVYLNAFKIFEYIFENLNDQYDVMKALFTFIGHEKLLKKRISKKLKFVELRYISRPLQNFYMRFSA